MAVARSALDLAAIGPGADPAQSVRDVLTVADAADAAGYHRFWVAEHHGSPRCAGSAPTVLMAAVAAATRQIRVGAGGVMLPNHAPFVVAEQFAVLEALFPGRIDLGVGRASGTSSASKQLDSALRRDTRDASDFPALVDELLELRHPELYPQRRYPAIRVAPDVAQPRELFVLGSSEQGARLAAQRSLPFVYGHHLGVRKARPAAPSTYFSAFVPGRFGAEPRLLVSVAVVCAGTDERAESLAFDAARAKVRTVAIEPLSDAREQYLARQELTETAVLHGSAATVDAGIDRLAAQFGADEVILVPYETTADARARTLREAAGVARVRAVPVAVDA